jgi:acetoin:2,6-dichlorophenolindophenol oxidoreductase subunit alpha
VPGYQVDGNDALAVYERTREAVEVCRQGRGPVLIEAKTFRHSGHHINDTGAYMPKDKLDFYLAKDPVNCTRRLLIDRHGFSEVEIGAIEAEVEREIEEAVQFASSAPEPSVAEFLEGIACL